MPLHVYYISMKNTNEKQTGITDLPSASGKRFKRKVWNIYKDIKTGEHYYQLQPYKGIDILIEPGINPDRGSEIVNAYNAEDREQSKVSRQRRWQIKKQGLGLCTICGRKREKYTERCNDCEAKKGERRRKNRLAQKQIHD